MYQNTIATKKNYKNRVKIKNRFKTTGARSILNKRLNVFF